ncbi:hypothetical protein M9Y10_043717 [Tritrichomonas musculus]|uniref:Uncharacterized protein n=1 Tax=Tritrichomonas musculus TaxID=1915356 RepID=A0ABR2K1K2_9EUKA
MCDIENKPEQQIGDFGPNSFVETTRQYINKLREQYESSQESLMSSVQSLFAGISSLSNGSTQNGQTSQKGEKLLDDLKKVEGVEVGNKNQNKVDININGSLFKVGISTLLSLAPQISTAVSST